MYTIPASIQERYTTITILKEDDANTIFKFIYCWIQKLPFLPRIFTYVILYKRCALFTEWENINENAEGESMQGVGDDSGWLDH